MRYYLTYQISLFNFDPTSLIILSFHQVESSNGEDDLTVVMIEVDDVRQRLALGLLVRDSLDEPVQVGSVATGGKELGVSKIRLVDSEDDEACARRMHMVIFFFPFF